MGKAFDKYQKRKLISSYFSVVLSVSLVLFLLGILGLVVMNTEKLGNHFKEQIRVAIFLNDRAKPTEIKQLQQRLTMADYTKEVVFISKDEAATNFADEIGEDFIQFIGSNPLQNSFELSLKSDFVSSASVVLIAEELENLSYVSEVNYDKPLIDLLNDNLNRISFWILLISVVLSFIAFLLINSSIRISIYSKRFIIKTMQMVGATKGFIRKPFITQNIKLSLIGAAIASTGVAGSIYAIQLNFPALDLMSDYLMLAGLFSGIFATGVLIAWISTYFAAQRFLNLRTAELYY